MQHCCDIISNGCNIVPILRHCVALRIVVAIRLAYLLENFLTSRLFRVAKSNRNGLLESLEAFINVVFYTQIFLKFIFQDTTYDTSTFALPRTGNSFQNLLFNNHYNLIIKLIVFLWIPFKGSMLNNTLISRNFLHSAFPCTKQCWKKVLKVLFTCSRENSWHFASSPLVIPRNDVWETSAEIRYWWRVTIQDLGSASDWLKICFIWREPPLMSW